MEELLAKLQGMGGSGGGGEAPSFNYRSQGRGNNRQQMPSSLDASTKPKTDPLDDFANAMLAKRKNAQMQTDLNASANSAGDTRENYGGLA